MLATIGKGWASRVFFSDNGSTGMEVALKMALRATGKRYGWQGVDGHEVGVIGLKGGYHGDTVSREAVRRLTLLTVVADRVHGRLRSEHIQHRCRLVPRAWTLVLPSGSNNPKWQGPGLSGRGR